MGPLVHSLAHSSYSLSVGYYQGLRCASLISADCLASVMNNLNSSKGVLPEDGVILLFLLKDPAASFTVVAHSFG